MFLLKTNGKKWSNSEGSVLQGNRGRFARYLTQCLKHTAVFPHEFYSPKHSEEHTADNNTRSIIHSVPNFISSPPFSRCLYTCCARTLALYHTHIQNARWCGCLPSNPELKHATSRARTLNTHVKPWKPTSGQTVLRFSGEAPWMSSFQREVHVTDLSRDGVRETGGGWDREEAAFNHTRGGQDAKGYRIVNISKW